MPNVYLIGELDSEICKSTVESLVEADEDVNMYISTSGGLYSVGLAIINAMRICKFKVNTYNIGFCHSTGSFILAAGTGRRIAFERSNIIVHDLMMDYETTMNASKLTKESRSLNKDNAELAKIISDLTKNSIDDVFQWMTTERSFTPREALKNGFVDEVHLNNGNVVRSRR